MEVIVDGKTVSLRHYLNKTLKPKLSEEGEALYPLYTIVVYQRKNTTFKTFRDIRSNDKSAILVSETNEPLLSDNSLEKFLPDVYSTDKLILGVIEKDIARSKHSFQIKGLKEKLKKLSLSIDEAILYDSKDSILEFIQERISYKHYMEICSHSKNDKNLITNLLQFYYNHQKEELKNYNSNPITALHMIVLFYIDWIGWWQNRNGRITLYDWFYKGKQFEAEKLYMEYIEHFEDTNNDEFKSLAFGLIGEDYKQMLNQDNISKSMIFHTKTLKTHLEDFTNY